MSSFKGLFSNLPGISCDHFRGEAEVNDQFFISHCHSDHMVGLDKLAPLLCRRNSVRVNHRIYCSMISKVFILRRFPFLHEKMIKDIFPNEPIIIDVFDKDSESFYKLSVTTIPADHCPGSVMFLFEAHHKTILYTGDFRFESKSLQSLKSLHDAHGSVLNIDEMYLDTTFCHPGYKVFPTREESIENVWNLVNTWIRKNGIYRKSRPKHVVLFELPAQFGSERILKEIFERSGCRWRIHVSQRKFLDYLCSDELGDCTTSDPKMGEWIHACSWQDAEVKAHRVKKSSKEIPCAKGLFEVRSIKPSALYFLSNVGDANEEMSFVKQTRKQTFRVCYSSHSSMKELMEFVNHFQPKKIIPCVDPPGMTRAQVLNILTSSLEAKNDIFESCHSLITLEKNHFINKRRSSELYLSTSSSDEESTIAISKRKKFGKSKTNLNPNSKSEEYTFVNPLNEDISIKKSRRASLPHNLKIPSITITPSSPSLDPSHPNYPEFYEGKFYIESSKNVSTSISIEEEEPSLKDTEVEDLDSTPELDVIFHSAKTASERKNCINFAKNRNKSHK
ncbi:protein artemis [Lepeophtheirus salmonis]|uniref:protein artemis n=1 Tax=Lepeophtheirus salmonis TaxID=72036 RepID=UPI001AEA4C61|nr:protein artemis-like [Lepeophtheirus salmonis]